MRAETGAAGPGAERARYWRADDLGGLELLRATYTSHRFAPHSHPGYVIAVIEAGVHAFAFRGSVAVAPAGSVVLVNPDERHTGHGYAGHGWSYRVLYPDAELLRQVLPDPRGRRPDVPRFRSPVVRDPALGAHVAALHAALEEPGASLEREWRLLEVLAAAVAHHTDRAPWAGGGREPAAVRRARDLLDAHLADNVSLDRLATEVGLSPFHLARVFRRDVGLAPHESVLQQRVGRAKGLLRAGAAPAQVAAEVGFYDQSHLNRHFKRRVGVTPVQYQLGAHL